MPNEGGGPWSKACDGSVFELKEGGGAPVLHLGRVSQHGREELNKIELTLERYAVL